MVTRTIERAPLRYTATYFGNEGNGRYQDDYNRLVTLAPFSGRAETLGGEIMRALTSINDSFYTYGTLNDLLDEFNFLAMVGIFHETNSDQTLATIHPHVKETKVYSGIFDGDEVQMAIERINDLTVEFMLKYPDLEYADMTLVDPSVYENCETDFMERIIAAWLMLPQKPEGGAMMQMPASSPSSKEMTTVQEVSTPRIANTISYDSYDLSI